jgi:hypothetical protein
MAITVRSAAAFGNNGGKEIAEAHVRVDYGQMRFSFTVDRGYNQYTGKPGTTIYRLCTDSGSFIDIAKAMMEADPNAAIKAFGAALSEGLPAQRQVSEAA